MKLSEPAGRPRLKNILFATDLSSTAEMALAYALKIIERFGATVYAVHVLQPDIYPLPSPGAWSEMAQEAEAFRRDSRAHLERELQGCTHEIIFRPGKTWPTISAVIAEKQIDLVVLGTHNRPGTGEGFLGSTAGEIFSRTPCPVLAVGPAAVASPSQKGGLDRILYATDFGAESLAGAPYAISLAKNNHAQLILLHAINNGADAAAMSDTLRCLVPLGAELESEPDYVVEHGAPPEKILEVAIGRGADLIVLGVNGRKRQIQRRLIPSGAMQIVAKAKCPVLVVSG